MFGDGLASSPSYEVGFPEMMSASVSNGSKPWTDEIVRAAGVVITTGSGDACPVFPDSRYLDWTLDDPAGMSVEVVRA